MSESLQFFFVGFIVLIFLFSVVGGYRRQTVLDDTRKKAAKDNGLPETATQEEIDAVSFIRSRIWLMRMIRHYNLPENATAEDVRVASEKFQKIIGITSTTTEADLLKKREKGWDELDDKYGANEEE